jgi:hypothetical protein
MTYRRVDDNLIRIARMSSEEFPERDIVLPLMAQVIPGIPRTNARTPDWSSRTSHFLFDERSRLGFTPVNLDY